MTSRAWLYALLIKASVMGPSLGAPAPPPPQVSTGVEPVPPLPTFARSRLLRL
jgi:hypothetical protein